MGNESEQWLNELKDDLSRENKMAEPCFNTLCHYLNDYRKDYISPYLY